MKSKDSKFYLRIRKIVKEIIVVTRKQFIVAFIVSLFVSIFISWLLTYSNDISPTGAIILGVFQVIIYNTFWFTLETKFRLEDRDHLKTKTDLIIESFAKSNFLSERLNDTFLNYLSLDKKIISEPIKVREYHLHIFNLKLKYYLNEYFNVNDKQIAIFDIPTSYFEKRIWEHFIDISGCYYSVQTLTGNKIDVYLKNTKRQDKEMNYLHSKLDGEGKTQLKKIFVIDDAYFDANNKLKNSTQKDKLMYTYMQKWKTKFPKVSASNTTNHFPIKVAKKSQVDGVVEDIGIFGPVYGIQGIREASNILEDELKIDFYFSENETNLKKKRFLEVFDKPEVLGLSDVF
jgi:hypothetical protein